MTNDIYFVLNGFLDGDGDHPATPAGGGDDPPQEDGWYFLPVGATDGVGPHLSRQEALAAQNARKRYFLVGDGPTREIAEDAIYDGPDHVFIVHPPMKDRHDARRYELSCYYDDRGVWEFVSNMTLDDGLAAVKQALRVSP